MLVMLTFLTLESFDLMQPFLFRGADEMALASAEPLCSVATKQSPGFLSWSTARAANATKRPITTKDGSKQAADRAGALDARLTTMAPPSS